MSVLHTVKNENTSKNAKKNNNLKNSKYENEE